MRWDSLSVVAPIGIAICVCLFGLSAYLAAIVQRRRAMIGCAIATFVILLPTAILFLHLALFELPRGERIGSSLVLLLMAGPYAIAWLTGLAVGLLIRVIRHVTRRGAPQ